MALEDECAPPAPVRASPGPGPGSGGTTRPSLPCTPARTLADVDARAEIKDFLTSRRARVTPDTVGLPSLGGRRRVPGLRREEVAMLAGVSVDYYTRLERGNMAGVSEEVLEAIVQALRLDDAERSHLFDLARSVSSSAAVRRRRSRRPTPTVRPALQWLLDSISTPAAVRDTTSTFLAWNMMAQALYAPLLAEPAPELAHRAPNMARFVFLDPRSRSFFPNWQQSAEDTVAILRLAAGHELANPAISELVGDLSTRSREFASLWAVHDVRHVCRSSKVIVHPVVGELDLVYEPMSLGTNPDLTMLVYSAEPGSATADALRLLESWAATTQSAAAQSVRSTQP